ncbi:unnamed protein product [Choristocarpus tenellus]
MVAAFVSAVVQGIIQLRSSGVLGKIMVMNVQSLAILPGLAASGLSAEVLSGFDTLAATMNGALVATLTQADLWDGVKLLDTNALFTAFTSDAEVIESLGFSTEGLLGVLTPCLFTDFQVDARANIMGTEYLSPCEGPCILCNNGDSPCQECFEGKPSVDSICEDPDARVFWDFAGHPTTFVHELFATIVIECAKDAPDYSMPLVKLTCPATSS